MSWLGPALALLVAGAPASKGIHWQRDFDAAQRAARRDEKPLMVDFFAAWCGWCKHLDQSTYVDPEVVRLSKDFVAVKVDTEGRSREIALATRYGVSSLPTIVFLSPAGNVLLRVDGFQAPGVFPETMLRARDLAQRVTALEKSLASNADDAAALTLLGQHLFEREDAKRSREMLQRAIKHDAALPVPKRKRTRLYLAMLQRDERRYAQAEALLLEALRQKPADAIDAKLLYMLARTYLDWGRDDNARTTLLTLIADYPKTPLAQKARELLHELVRPH